MAKKNFIMLELDDSKTKKIANVVSNNSCRKILDFLADKEATESELAKKLDLPISTVHYNLQQLMETGLVIADEYHYSDKGKEVNHYKLANKYIIITPKKVTGITQKLKNILPAALITTGIAGILQFYKMFSEKAIAGAEPMLMKTAERTFDAAEEAVLTAANGAGMPAPELASQALQTPVWQNLALWFLIGALSALAIYVLISWLRKE